MRYPFLFQIKRPLSNYSSFFLSEKKRWITSSPFLSQQLSLNTKKYPSSPPLNVKENEHVLHDKNYVFGVNNVLKNSGTFHQECRVDDSYTKSSTIRNLTLDSHDDSNSLNYPTKKNPYVTQPIHSFKAMQRSTNVAYTKQPNGSTINDHPNVVSRNDNCKKINIESSSDNHSSPSAMISRLLFFRRALILFTGGCTGYYFGTKWKSQSAVINDERASSIAKSSMVLSNDKTNDMASNNINHVKQIQTDTPDSSPDCFLEEVTDTYFDSTDNLCIFWFTSKDDLIKHQQAIKSFTQHILSLNLPVSLHFAYSIKPSVNEGLENQILKESDHNAPESIRNNQQQHDLVVVLYKGQRKYLFHTVDSTSPDVQDDLKLQDEIIINFFQPLSEEIEQENISTISSTDDMTGSPSELQQELKTNSAYVDHITYRTFEKEVIEASSNTHPIIVQLMEDSCFLCFLMRPFINSVHQILKDYEVPLTIKRFNLDKNDFPPGCPIVRSTPNFVFYNGEKDVTPIPWKEYKPKEFIERLCQEMKLSDDICEKLNAAVVQLQERFQKFGLLSIWTQELSALQQFMFETNEDTMVNIQTEKLDNQVNDTEIDKEYSDIVNELVKQDIVRDDCLNDNIEYLNSEIASTEADCVAYAKMLGPKLEKAKGKHFDLIKARLLYDEGSEKSEDINDRDNNEN